MVYAERCVYSGCLNYTLDPLNEFCHECSDEAIEPEIFHPQTDLSDHESEPDDFFSGQSESESGNESQQASDKEGTDEDTKMDNTKKQEKARARKKRYLKNKKSKKQKLDIDDLPKKFKEQCSTGINVEACEDKEQVAKIEEPVAEQAAGPSLSRKRRLAREADVTQKLFGFFQFGRRVQKALQCLGYRLIC
ncbi:hypothetical protein DAPPUDRAFT_333199 [Daphnia pulex]|uniref:Uncharacterized protein n=1 Tax=Daphnia pulex TaxID=6669 RepID=E9HS65_DAPPU|nr:hypothetical protein DAPPUDRAFT_333199 [Daphnia pulex]|eukprot:EFX65388.1 hypothetical protein DAPPUDRAFT_333199 [Daphnia pulex]